MSARDDGGPAFPCAKMSMDGERIIWPESGMSLRTYAAIQLCVPDSGIDWLDDMIRQSQRDRLAGQALIGACAGAAEFGQTWEEWEQKETLASEAWNLAHAMLAREDGVA